jgi:hypothetical protein
MKKLLITSVAVALSACCTFAQSTLRLWYDKPATHWLEALPIGNSHLGGMVYGGADTEQIQLNEETFWSGSPYQNNSQEAKSHLAEVRKLIFEGREKEAVGHTQRSAQGGEGRVQQRKTVNGKVGCLVGHTETKVVINSVRRKKMSVQPLLRTRVIKGKGRLIKFARKFRLKLVTQCLKNVT